MEGFLINDEHNMTLETCYRLLSTANCERVKHLVHHVKFLAIQLLVPLAKLGLGPVDVADILSLHLSTGLGLGVSDESMSRLQEEQHWQSVPPNLSPLSELSLP